MHLEIVILAAGKGKRMHSALPKVLHVLGAKPLLLHVIETAKALKPERIHVVYGNGGEQVKNFIKACDANINCIMQKKQLGTAHAVQQALPSIAKKARVLVLYGDVPLITPKTLGAFLEQSSFFDVGILTAELLNPHGFGRIVRDITGNIERITEEKDATLLERAIKEINTGIMLCDAEILQRFLPKIKSKNAQKEFYFTDIISLAKLFGFKVGALKAEVSEEILGVNDKVQLAFLERFYQKREAKKLLKKGITLKDPDRFDLRGELNAGQDVTLDINIIIEGNVNIGDASFVGANCYLKDVRLGKNVVVRPNSIIEDSIIEDGCVIGPFARIRPESRIRKNAHIGNFVEIKKSDIGCKSKVNHLTYLGDTVVGKDVNVGAGTITCNYDGAKKFQTIIEDGAFIGSASQLVAPVKVGKKAYIGTGSTITEDAPAGKLTLARARQVTIKKWKKP